MAVLEINDDQFESNVIKSDKPTLVDFWAPWCGPCRAIAPIIEELSHEFENKINFCKLNVDENSTTPTKYAIKAIPTIILFKDGKIADQIVGAASKTSLTNTLNKVL